MFEDNLAAIECGIDRYPAGTNSVPYYDAEAYIRALQQEIVRLKKRISKLEEQITDDGK